MPDTNLNEWLARIRDQILALLTVDLGLQGAVIVLAVILGAILRPLTHWLIDAFDRRRRSISFLRQARWVDEILASLDAIRWPLTAYILVHLGLGALTFAGRETVIVSWAAPFLLLWAINRAFRALFRRHLAPEQAQVWANQIVRPLLIGVGLLQALTLFDNLWAWRITFGDNSFTFGAVVVAAVVAYIFLQLSRSSREVLGQTVLPRAGIHPTLTQVLASFFGYIVALIGIALAFTIVGIKLTTLTVILGGLSVGLGFAMQDIIGNFISGFILLFDRTIVPGDVVSVDDHFGRVTSIGIRTTRVRTLDNVELIVPNSDFLSGIVENYSSGDPKVRIAVIVGVSYDVEPRLVEKALLEAAEGMPVLDVPAPSVQFIDFGASSLDFRLLVWLSDPMQTNSVQSQLRYRIWERFQVHNIPIPFPQRDVHIRSLPDNLADLAAGAGSRTMA